MKNETFERVTKEVREVTMNEANELLKDKAWRLVGMADAPKGVIYVMGRLEDVPRLYLGSLRKVHPQQ